MDTKFQFYKMENCFEERRWKLLQNIVNVLNNTERYT